MAKQQSAPCRSKRKNKFDFSESELDAAEQLIQLSSDSNKDNNNGFEGSTTSELSDGDSTHLNLIVTSNKNPVEEYDQDQTIVGFDQRKRRRFKSVCEIYSLTKPLSVK